MIFNQPFPRESNLRKQFFNALFSGIIVTLFLWVFKPFGFGTVPFRELFFFASGYGIITFFVVMAFGLLEKFIPGIFAEERWTVGKNIALYLAIIFVIGCLNLLYTAFTTGMQLSVKTFISFQLFTLAVTFVVVSALTMIKYFNSINFYKEGLKKFEEEIKQLETVNEPVFITIKSENEKENMTLGLNELYYIESADNYSKVVYKNNNKITSSLIRSSLKKLEEQFTQPELFRCHRTFIVQLRNVERVTGNSQGYRLHFKDVPESVPVSRRLNEEIHNRLKTVSLMSNV